MKTIIYIIAGLILLAIGPQLILGIIFTVGIYYFLCHDYIIYLYMKLGWGRYV